MICCMYQEQHLPHVLPYRHFDFSLLSHEDVIIVQNGIGINIEPIFCGSLTKEWWENKQSPPSFAELCDTLIGPRYSHLH